MTGVTGMEGATHGQKMENNETKGFKTMCGY